jgi:hypothetical protein
MRVRMYVCTIMHNKVCVCSLQGSVHVGKPWPLQVKLITMVPLQTGLVACLSAYRAITRGALL